MNTITDERLAEIERDVGPAVGNSEVIYMARELQQRREAERTKRATPCRHERCVMWCPAMGDWMFAPEDYMRREEHHRDRVQFESILPQYERWRLP